MCVAEGIDLIASPEDQAGNPSTGEAVTKSKMAASKSSAAFDSSDFDRLLEAASSGGMSDKLDSESGGVLQGVDLQGPIRRLNSTLSSNSTLPMQPVVYNPAQNLTQAMQRLNLTSSSGKAEALRQQRLATEIRETKAH